MFCCKKQQKQRGGDKGGRLAERPRYRCDARIKSAQDNFETGYNSIGQVLLGAEWVKIRGKEEERSR
jgi:hypothetical protein